MVMPIQLLNFLNFQDILPSLCFFSPIPEDERAALRVRIIQKNTIKENKRHKNKNGSLTERHRDHSIAHNRWGGGPELLHVAQTLMDCVAMGCWRRTRERERERKEGQTIGWKEGRQALYCESLISGSQVSSLSPCGLDR